MKEARRTAAILIVIVAGTALVNSPWALAQTEFERFVESCGHLKTVAGKGLGDKGTNWWKPQFEGARATEVELSNSHITMADTAGNYYIADKESHQIIKVDPHGIATTFAGTGRAGFNATSGKATEVQLHFPNGLYALPDGTVYILDNFNRMVRKVDSTGQLTTLFKDPDGFHFGRTLWVSKDGETIYYCSSPSLQCEIRRWTKAGGNITTLAAGFVDLAYMDVDASGSLYLTDQGQHQVYRLSPDGESKVVVAGNGTTEEPESGKKAIDIGLNEVRGIALLPEGGFLLCTHKGGDVVHVDSKGIANVLVHGSGKGNVHEGDGKPVTEPGTKISEPRSVTLAPDGDVIITANDSGIVRVIPRNKP